MMKGTLLLHMVQLSFKNIYINFGVFAESKNEEICALQYIQMNKNRYGFYFTGIDSILPNLTLFSWMTSWGVMVFDR